MQQISPPKCSFSPDGEVLNFPEVGRRIGTAVPVGLALTIGTCIGFVIEENEHGTRDFT